MATRLAVLVTGVCVGVSLAHAADEPVELTFAPARPVAGGIAGVGTAVADFDGDGDQDVAVILGGQTMVQIRRYDPAAPVGNPFAADLSIDLPETPNGIDTADFDRDGRPDLVMSAPTGLYVAFNRGLVGGTLDFDVSVRQHSNSATFTLVFEGVRAADVDLDGFVDFVAYGVQPSESQFRQGFVLSFGNAGSDGPFGWFGPKNLVIGLNRFTDLAVGDVTGEGYPDYVLPSVETYTVTIIPITGSGFTPNEPKRHDSLLTPTAVALVDLTGDGQLEIAAVGHFYASGTERMAVDILRNVPTGVGSERTFEPTGVTTYAQIALPAPATFSEDIAVGDFDGDGVSDLVVTQYLNSSLSVIRLTPRIDQSGDFDGFDRLQTQIPLEFESLPRVLTVASISGDGKDDIVIGQQSGSHPVTLLVNTTEGGVVTPPTIDPATAITFDGGKLVRGAYQVGKKFKFAAVQTLRDEGVTVRLQTSTDPTVESTWADIADGALMTPPTGRAAVWKLKSSSIRPGIRWFRTVTEKAGLEPGVNDVASVHPGDAGYVGPFEIVGDGPILAATCVASPESNPFGDTTYPGDRITYSIRLENLGDRDATECRVTARSPQRTTFVQALGDHTIDASSSPATIVWSSFTLAPGDIALRLFTVQVDQDARTDVVFLEFKFVATDRKATNSAPCRLRIASPISLVVTSGAALVTPGDAFSYSLRATNSSSVALSSAVVTDKLPDDTGFEAAHFLDANGSIVNPPVENPRGGPNPLFDPETRLVTWFLGDIPANSSREMRLDVRVQYDRVSAGQIRNGAYGLFGCSPTGGCDPRNPEKGDLASGEPADVFTDLSGSPALTVPVLRLSHYDVPNRNGRLHDPVFGDVGTVLPGGQVDYFFFLKNTGSTAARGIRFSGSPPNGATVIPGAIGVDGIQHAFTLSPGGGTLSLFLGDLYPGSSRLITFRVDVPLNAPTRTFLMSNGFHVRCESLSGVLHATPTEVRTQIVTPISFELDTEKDRGDFDFGPDAGEAGKLMTFTSRWRNNGDETASNVVVTQTLPYGTALHVVRDGGGNVVDEGIVFDTEFAGTTWELVNGKKGNADAVVFRIPSAPGRSEGFVSITVRMAEAPARGDGSVSSNASITGGYGPSAGKPGDPNVIGGASSQTAGVNGGTRTRIYVGKSAPLTAVRGLDLQYTIFWGNLGDVPAKDMKVTVFVPKQTRLLPPEKGNAGKANRNGTSITWNLGTLPPHSSGSGVFSVNVDPNFQGCMIVEDTCRVTAGNAIERCAPPLMTFALTPHQNFDAFSWEGYGCYLQKLGIRLENVFNAALEEEIGKFGRTSFATSVGGADIVTLQNGTFLIPLGAGQVLAGGGPGMATLPGLNFTTGNGGFIVASGGGNLIDLKNVAGFGSSVSATSVLSNLLGPSGLVAQGGGNIVASGGGNLIGMDGASLIGNDGGSLAEIRQAIAALVAQGGGNAIAPAGGNIVPVGLIGNDGGSLIANDGGTLVAQGGGNFHAMSTGIVAGGGGNIVAGGGGN